MPNDFTVSIVGDLRNLESSIKRGEQKLDAFAQKAKQRQKIQLTASIARLQVDLDKARRELAKFKKEGDEKGQIKARIDIQNLQSKIKTARGAIRDLDKETNKASKSFFRLNGIIRDALKAFGGFLVIQKFTQAIRGAFNASVSFESAFAGVRKTVEATEAEFAELSKEFRNLAKEIPLTVEQLAKIGELGGQLGVAKESLIDFTKTIAEISVATNLTEEAAATSFARIANIFQVPIESVGNMASAVVDLGNNFATTESEIVEFATRIAGAGKVAGLASSDIFAIATAFTSVGVQAEAGGTAVQKVLFTLNNAVASGGEELEKFARLTGQSADEFVQLWRSRPARAFELFVKGLENAGDDASNVLEDLVAGDQRLARAFLSVAQAGDLLTNAVDRSSEAFAANTALTEEAEKRFATTESRIQNLKNRLNDVGITFGNILKEFFLPTLEFLTKLAEDLVNGTKQLGQLANAIKVAGIAFTAFLGAKILAGIAAGFAAIRTAALAARVSIAAMGTGASVAAKALGVLRLAMAALGGPLVLGATLAITGIGLAMFSARKRAQELKNATESLGSALDELSKTASGIGQISGEFNQLLADVKKTGDEINRISLNLARGIGQNERGLLGGLREDFSRDLDLLRDKTEQVFRSLGANSDQVQEITSELKFFRKEIQPTAADLEALEKTTRKFGEQFSQTASDLDRQIAFAQKFGVEFEDAFQNAFDKVKEGFEGTEEEGKLFFDNLIADQTKRVAEMEGIGQAFGFGIGNGLSSEQVSAALSQAGLDLNTKFIAKQLDLAIKAKDVGAVYGFLLKEGIETTFDEVEGASNRLGEFVREKLQQKSQAVRKAAFGLGADASGSVVQGLTANFGPLQKAAAFIARILGTFGKVSKFLGFTNIPIFKGLGGTVDKLGSAADEAGRLLNELTDIQKVGAGGGTVGSGSGRSGGGGGGGGRNPAEDALKEAEKSAKEAEKAVEGYNKELERLGKISDDLNDKTRDFFQDIVDTIGEADAKIKDLQGEFEKFQEEEGASFIRKSAERDVELAEEEKNIKEEISKVSKEQVEDEEDRKRQQEEVNELNRELNEILKERTQISQAFSGAGSDLDNEAKFQDEITRAKERAAATEFELDKLNFEERIQQQKDIVDAQIAAQRKIIEVQQRFLEIQKGNDVKAKREQMALQSLVDEEFINNLERRNEVLEQLGFDDLTREQELELLKQIERKKSLDEERRTVEAQQREILAEKEQFFNLAKQAHAESVENMKQKTQELIEIIRRAQQEQIRLNALRNSGGGRSSRRGSTTNVNVTNNISSGVDFSSATNSLIRKINQ